MNASRFVKHKNIWAFKQGRNYDLLHQYNALFPITWQGNSYFTVIDKLAVQNYTLKYA